ncbi:hypothetical protein [Variovorax sp. E3]|uniref:hypothetical protein n=1 Tax=Variovorax sp. E3 TaxID=1914993 RepID=UPI0018DC62CE|nr:hypothetical protein [Variovorax sp. E3]
MNTRWIESETDVLFRLRDSKSTFANLIHFAVEGAFPDSEHALSHDLLVAINVPRRQLGLSAHGKPGDVDLLIVPMADGPMCERAIAIEAKIVRPTLENPSRNANSMGASQVVGLLNDGFPLVGLAHITIPTPLPPEMHWSIPWWSGALGPDRKPQKTGKTFAFDPFPLLSAERQQGRVLALALPPEVGYKVMGITLSKDRQRFAGNTMGEGRRASFNPLASAKLIEGVADLCHRRSELFQRIRWRS